MSLFLLLLLFFAIVVDVDVVAAAADDDDDVGATKGKLLNKLSEKGEREIGKHELRAL